LQVRTKVLDHLQHIAQLMAHWRSSSCSAANAPTPANGSNSTKQQQQQAAMDKAVSDLLHLTKAMYIITPHIVYALKDVNLLTGRPETPPDSESQQQQQQQQHHYHDQAALYWQAADAAVQALPLCKWKYITHDKISLILT
jgi:hypothetical protein